MHLLQYNQFSPYTDRHIFTGISLYCIAVVHYSGKYKQYSTMPLKDYSEDRWSCHDYLAV